MVSRLGILGSIAALALMMADRAVAQDDEDAAFDRSPTSCISVSRIRRTEIIDDRTILFHMRGGRIYSNLLNFECRDLKRNDQMAYTARGGRLCKSDTIRVLEPFDRGFGMVCPIGQFLPITEGEADAMRIGPDGPPDLGNSVVITEVEIPDEDTAPADGERGEAPESE